MKNIYIYRMFHLDSLEERINIDTSTWHFRDGPSDLDSLLPNYDEYLAEFKLLKFVCCWADNLPWRCFDDLPRIKYPIIEPINSKYRMVVGYDSKAHGNVEFYKFYKNTREVLIRRSSKYTELEREPDDPWCETIGSFGIEHENQKTLWYRYDVYYNPDLRSRSGDMKARFCEWYPPPIPLMLEKRQTLFEDICPPHKRKSPYSLISQPVDHYLVALDVDTREVYFISGEDIYLSRATALYRYGESPREPRDISEWELPEKQVYIQDRLYRYRVENVKEENIISKDDSKIVLELTGSEYGKALKLQVTNYNERPELLDVEVIN